MWYYAIVYFNWVFAIAIWGFNRWRKGRVKGLCYIATGSTLELLAFFIHWRDWYRLRGQPDQMYVWILPLMLSLVAFVLVIIGTVRSFLTADGAGPAIVKELDIA